LSNERRDQKSADHVREHNRFLTRLVAELKHHSTNVPERAKMAAAANVSGFYEDACKFGGKMHHGLAKITT